MMATAASGSCSVRGSVDTEARRARACVCAATAAVECHRVGAVGSAGSAGRAALRGRRGARARVSPSRPCIAVAKLYGRQLVSVRGAVGSALLRLVRHLPLASCSQGQAQTMCAAGRRCRDAAVGQGTVATGARAGDTCARGAASGAGGRVGSQSHHPHRPPWGALASHRQRREALRIITRCV